MLERAGWQSLCDSTGGQFYGDLMTEDALMVLVGGMILTREEVVDSLSDAPAWSRFEIVEPRFITVSADVVTLVYTGKSWRDEDTVPFMAAMSSTYVLSDDGWKLTLYQQTRQE